MTKRIYSASACLVLWLSSTTMALGSNDDIGAPAQLSLQNLRAFTDAFEQIRSNYIEEIDDITLLRAAIRGMVAELDAHSAFFEPDPFQALGEATRGRQGGIGADIAIRDNRLVVAHVRAGGPSERAGLRQGDVLVAIDGVAVRGRKLSQSLADLKGSPGSEVRLLVRSGPGPAQEQVLTRDYEDVDSVTSRWVQPGIGLLSVSHFHGSSDAEFLRHLEQLKRKSPEPLRGLVLDLRQNPGGVLESAVAIADGLLDEGMIVRTSSRYPATRLEYQAQQGQWIPGVPVAVLVDGRTASASEALAEALQDHGRARVFGSTTFGKGSIQSLLYLRDGSGLRLTTAVYYTPRGRSLLERGIEPDVAVEGGASLDEAVRWLRSPQPGES